MGKSSRRFPFSPSSRDCVGAENENVDIISLARGWGERLGSCLGSADVYRHGCGGVGDERNILTLNERVWVNPNRLQPLSLPEQDG